MNDVNAICKREYISSADTKKTFHFNTSKIADKGIKNHYIISNNTSTNNGKNTCKMQVCNQQEIN